MKDNDRATKALLKGFAYLMQIVLDKTNKTYDGIIVSSAENGKWNIKFNGEVHTLPPYGSIVPTVGKMVKVQIPDNNMARAYFE